MLNSGWRLRSGSTVASGCRCSVYCVNVAGVMAAKALLARSSDRQDWNSALLSWGGSCGGLACANTAGAEKPRLASKASWGKAREVRRKFMLRNIPVWWHAFW
ncbi:hypothetical protein D3C72_1143630 [compost metagenome]